MSEKPAFTPHEIQWDGQKTLRLWQYYSNSAAHRKKYFGLQSGREVANLLKRKLFAKVSSILDFSCGRGDVIMACLPYMKGHQRIHGADISQESVRTTLECVGQHPAFSGGTVIDGYPTPFKDGSYDLVITTEVVEHLDDAELESMLAEAWRVLKAGGYIFVTTPFNEDLEKEKTMCPECGCTFHRWQHLRSWTLESLTAVMERHDFVTIECRNIQWGPTLLKWYFRMIGRPGNGIYFIGRKP